MIRIVLDKIGCCGGCGSWGDRRGLGCWFAANTSNTSITRSYSEGSWSLEGSRGSGQRFQAYDALIRFRHDVDVGFDSTGGILMETCKLGLNRVE